MKNFKHLVLTILACITLSCNAQIKDTLIVCQEDVCDSLYNELMDCQNNDSLLRKIAIRDLAIDSLEAKIQECLDNSVLPDTLFIVADTARIQILGNSNMIESVVLGDLLFTRFVKNGRRAELNFDLNTLNLQVFTENDSLIRHDINYFIR